METTLDHLENLDDDFNSAFDDIEENQLDGLEETPDTEPAEPPAEPNQDPAEPTIAVRYNGTDLEIPMTEAKALAQKGMNYDHIKGELDALRSSPEMSVFGDLAKAMNMTQTQLADLMRQEMQRVELGRLQMQGMTPQAAGTLMRQQQALLELQQKQRQADEQRQTQEVWNDFFQKHPDVTDAEKTLTPETWALIASGKDPGDAYAKQLAGEYKRQAEELRTQLDKQAQSQAAAAKSPGSANGDGANEDFDDFLSAYFNS